MKWRAAGLGLVGFGVGCGGASPEPAVGARPSEVAVVDLDAAKPPPVTAATPSAAASAAPVASAQPSDPEKSQPMTREELLRAMKSGELGGILGVMKLDGTGDVQGFGGIGTGPGGVGTGTGLGFGSGRLSGGPRQGTPKIRQGASVVQGKLPPEVIQRIVRANFGRFRMCYENALKHSPKLAGKITVHFVIEGDGSVKTATNGGSDLPDPGVVGCVVRSFLGLSFPPPESGLVSVNYPLMFAPGDDTTPTPAAPTSPAPSAVPAPAPSKPTP